MILLFFPKQRSAITAKIVPVAKGWARNEVNAVIFRRNSIVTHNNIQCVAFYDDSANVILAKRRIGTEKWEIRKTQYKGNVKDAHNSISIIVDGHRFLHMSWDQHNNPLRYCRSKKPESLELSEKICMIGAKEQNVTYPEFYKLPDGNLIFIYRDGSSGNGNIIMSRNIILFIMMVKIGLFLRFQSAKLHSALAGVVQKNTYFKATAID